MFDKLLIKLGYKTIYNVYLLNYRNRYTYIETLFNSLELKKYKGNKNILVEKIIRKVA